MTTNSPICISGLGMVTPVGNDRETFWNSLCQGRSGIRRLENVDTTDLPCPFGGEVRDLDLHPLDAHPKVNARRMDRASLFAVMSSRQALLDAGLPILDVGNSCSVVFGAGLAGLLTLQENTEKLLDRGPRAVSPLTIPILMPNAAVANICLAFGITGVSQTVSTACSSSGHALLDAIRLIRAGETEIVLTGGTEASLTRLGLSSFVRMGAMQAYEGDAPETLIRPFDAERRGLIMSEGSVALVVETLDHALARGQTPYALIRSGASTTDAYHLVTPDPDSRGAIDAIRLALKRGGLDPHLVASEMYVNAHGTGTTLNDQAETHALKVIFGDAAHALQISSTKSITGHLIGAAAAVELAACALALQSGTLPPTINLDTPDPYCDLDYIPNVARHSPVRFALKTSFGFGGHNIAIVLERYVK